MIDLPGSSQDLGWHLQELTTDADRGFLQWPQGLDHFLVMIPVRS